MFKIGEFASLTGISIHMLRNYDKIGLLIPDYVDRVNNYRFYSENQIITANQIQILKDLGFGLKEIMNINKSSEDIHQLLKNKIDEMHEAAKHIEQQIQRIRQADRDLDHYNDLVFSVKITSLASRKVVSLREKISKFEEEGLLWVKLEQECSANNIRTLDNEYSYAITHSVDLENNIIDTEVMIAVSEIIPIKSQLKLYKIPVTEAAVITAKGIYSKISNISCYVHNYIKHMDYEISGAPLRRYFLSPRNGGDPQDYITEYIFPLKKI